MTVSESDFKACLGSFATGVTVITTMDAKKGPHGVTISAFSSLSLDPALVLFNLSNDSSSYPVFKRCKYFTINILAQTQAGLSQLFSSGQPQKWEQTPHSFGKNATPILDNVVAYIECKLETKYKGGDHTIFVGRVTHLKKHSHIKPLLYYQGQYTGLDHTIT